MEIDPTNFACNLVERYIVEALETGSVNGPDAMVRHKEVLLPSHKNDFFLCNVRFHNKAFLALLRVGLECGKLGPMANVRLGTGTPVLVLR